MEFKIRDLYPDELRVLLKRLKIFFELTGRQIYPLSEKIKPVMIDPKKEMEILETNGLIQTLGRTVGRRARICEYRKHKL